MNKESIYKIIGYNGEYNSNVKKAIRILLKENHPDKSGDSKIFKLINDVKEELENNKVSYSPKKNNNISKNDDIDYDYCLEMINKITKEKDIYTNILKRKKEKLSKIMLEYKNHYRDSVDLETYLLSNTQYMNTLRNNKKGCVIILIISIIVFIISIIEKNYIFFIIFVILVIICVLMIHESFSIMQKITDINRNKVNNYVGVNAKLRNNKNNQERLNKEIHELNKKISDMDNDLRFYDNLLNNR